MVVKQLEMVLAAEQLSTTAAVVALHLQRSPSYEDKMLSHMLWIKIREYEKHSDNVIDTFLK